MTKHHHRHDQAAPAHQEAGRSYLPQDLPEPYSTAFQVFRAFVTAETMDEHASALQYFAPNLVWDAPPILVYGADNIRVIAYLAKTVASLDVHPQLFKATRTGPTTSVLEFYTVFPVIPKRAWWAPFTYLIPNLPLKATLRLGIREQSNGTVIIESLWGRINNYPVLPAPVRAFNAYVMGNLMALAEPLWSQGVHLPPMNDPSYKTTVDGVPSFKTWGKSKAIQQ